MLYSTPPKILGCQKCMLLTFFNFYAMLLTIEHEKSKMSYILGWVDFKKNAIPPKILGCPSM
jgi:hypothetical protein